VAIRSGVRVRGRPEGRGVQPAHGRGQQSHCRSARIPQTYTVIARVNSPTGRWRRDHVAEGEEGHRGRHNHEGNLTEPGGEAASQVSSALGSSPLALDISGSSAALTDMPKQAHRQRIDDLGVGESRDGAGWKELARTVSTYALNLHHTSADEHREEFLITVATRRASHQAGQVPSRRRSTSVLPPPAGGSSTHGTPAAISASGYCAATGAESHERPDDGEVPDHRRGIREKESAMLLRTPRHQPKVQGVRRQERGFRQGGSSRRASLHRSRARSRDEPRVSSTPASTNTDVVRTRSAATALATRLPRHRSSARRPRRQG